MAFTEREQLVAPMFDRALQLRDEGQFDEAIEPSSRCSAVACCRMSIRVLLAGRGAWRGTVA
jgi:hypothetical protein